MPRRASSAERPRPTSGSTSRQPGQDHRLRWALKLLYAALDEKRRQEGSTWIALAATLSCSPGQLTGLRSAKYATTMDLAMRITQWLGRPAADFVYPAAWLAADKPPTH